MPEATTGFFAAAVGHYRSFEATEVATCLITVEEQQLPGRLRDLAIELLPRAKVTYKWPN